MNKTIGHKLTPVQVRGLTSPKKALEAAQLMESRLHTVFNQNPKLIQIARLRRFANDAMHIGCDRAAAVVNQPILFEGRLV